MFCINYRNERELWNWILKISSPWNDRDLKNCFPDKSKNYCSDVLPDLPTFVTINFHLRLILYPHYLASWFFQLESAARQTQYVTSSIQEEEWDHSRVQKDINIMDNECLPVSNYDMKPKTSVCVSAPRISCRIYFSWF